MLLQSEGIACFEVYPESTMYFVCTYIWTRQDKTRQDLGRDETEQNEPRQNKPKGLNKFLTMYGETRFPSKFHGEKGKPDRYDMENVKC